MSEILTNPYRYAVSLERCFLGGSTEFEGINPSNGVNYNRFGVGQQILAGSEYIGQTLTTASFYLKLGAGVTLTGDLLCRVIPNSGSGGIGGTDIGTIDMSTLTESVVKRDFFGDGTRELETNDCIFLLMPTGTPPASGYAIYPRGTGGTGFIDNQKMCLVGWLNGSRVFTFQNNDNDWCFNVPG